MGKGTCINAPLIKTTHKTKTKLAGTDRQIFMTPIFNRMFNLDQWIAFVEPLRRYLLVPTAYSIRH
jgi:hypothetical protein